MKETKKHDNTYLLSEERMTPALFKLGIPIAVSMLISALYNVVDTYFVSGLGTTEIAAVSVAFPISLVFSGIGLTFGLGGGSYISRLLGAGHKDQADRVFATAVITGGGTALVMALMMSLWLTPVLRFMGATDTILPYASSYAVIFIISNIFTAVNVTASNLAVSQGTSTISIIGMMVGAVLNTILDPIMIYTMGMGVKGAAAATLIAQLATSGIYLYYFTSKKAYVKLRLRNFAPSKKTYGEIIKIGIAMLFLQLLSSLSMSLISQGASNYGDEAVAALGVVLRIVTLGANVVFGYMKGFQPMAGYNFGAKNYSRVQEAIRCSIKWTMLFGVVWTAVIFLAAPVLLSGFSASQNFINIGIRALRANTIMFFSFGFQFTYSTLYLALGKARPGIILNLSRQGIFFIPVILLLPRYFGLDGVLFAQAVADMLTVVLTLILAAKINREIQELASAATPVKPDVTISGLQNAGQQV